MTEGTEPGHSLYWHKHNENVCQYDDNWIHEGGSCVDTRNVVYV
jgi:hypothetical protein